jgi:hypothetical protein
LALALSRSTKPHSAAHTAHEIYYPTFDDTSKYGTSDIAWLHKHIDPRASRLEGKPKFKYLLPLDDEITERIRPLSKTYPNLCATSKENVAPGVHPGEGGVNPTVAAPV